MNAQQQRVIQQLRFVRSNEPLRRFQFVNYRIINHQIQVVGLVEVSPSNR